MISLGAVGGDGDAKCVAAMKGRVGGGDDRVMIVNTVHEDEIVMGLRRHGATSMVLNTIRKPDAVKRFAAMAGYFWEDEFADRCREQGFEVTDLTAQHLSYDVLVGEYSVQTKAMGGESRAVIKSDAGGFKTYAADAFDYLALKNTATGEMYLIPQWRLLDRKNPQRMISSLRWDEIQSFLVDWVGVKRVLAASGPT